MRVKMHRVLDRVPISLRKHWLEAAKAISSQTKVSKYVNQSFNRCFSSSEESFVVPVPESKRFCKDCMVAVGTPVEYSNQLADVLVEADVRGHFSHGLNRLEMYVDDVLTKSCSINAFPEVIKETAATAYVNGRNGLGVVVGNFCMDLAVKKAKDAGVGWVVAKGSNHYGIAGWYSMQAMKEGMIGMSFTNTSPFSTPTRSKKSALGTNPISVAAKGAEPSDEFVLDMATTAVALGKVEIQRRKGQPIPEGWALDSEGKVTTDAEIAMQAGQLMPLGGLEIHGGYKGYGLQVVVELFCGILAGAAFGPSIRKWMTHSAEANLGQCFVAINPSCFAPNFQLRLSELIDTLRHLPSVEEDKPVLVAGDIENAHIDKIKTIGGIPYHKNQLLAANQLATKLKVEPMTSQKPHS